MKKIVAIIYVIMSFSLNAQSLDEFFTKTDAFLKTNVQNGRVAYSKIHKNPAELNALLNIAKEIQVSENDKANYQAFWINAYNLAVIKGIIDNYPIKSPLDIAGFFDETKYDIGGKNITLNAIENSLLRAKFKDPRFHFVLVCGAVGCPPIMDEAYKPNKLDAQMENQTIKSINGDFIRINKKKKNVEGSEILKWYKEDFTMHDSTEIAFLNTYLEEKIPTDYKLTYFNYDWSLNAQ